MYFNLDCKIIRVSHRKPFEFPYQTSLGSYSDDGTEHCKKDVCFNDNKPRFFQVNGENMNGENTKKFEIYYFGGTEFKGWRVRILNVIFKL